MHTFATAFAITALLSFSACGRSAAHDGPEHEIEELTARMEKNGESADLLTERAVEYRVLGKLPEATKDLERAAVLDPDSMAIHRELGRVYFLAAKPEEAIATVTRGLRLTTDEPAELASLRILRAEILRSLNDNKRAAEDADAAIALHKKNPEWYLLRSGIHRRLKAHQERLAGIEAGLKETGAGVLVIERVEALLDAGQFEAALMNIGTELEDSRIKSSWQIRRARALLGLRRKSEAEASLKAALAEIGTRLNAKTADVSLLLDRALAHELLDEKKEALRAYEDARDKGGGETLNDKIKALQEAITPKAAPLSEPNATKEKSGPGVKP